MDARLRPGGSLPLETLELNYDQVRVAIRPLQEQVKTQGLWAGHLDAELGGQGYGQVRLALMHEILGHRPPRAEHLRQQRTRLGQCRAVAVGIEAGNEEQRRRWLEPLLEGTMRSAYSMTEPNAAAIPH